MKWLEKQKYHIIRNKEKRYCYGPISCTAVADFGKPTNFDLKKAVFSERFPNWNLIKQAQKNGNLSQICYNEYRAFGNLTKFTESFDPRFGKCLWNHSHPGVRIEIPAVLDTHVS